MWKDNEKHYPQHLRQQLEEAGNYFSRADMSISQVLAYMQDHEPTKMEQNAIAKASSDMVFIRARLNGITKSLGIIMEKEIQKIITETKEK